MVDSESEGYAKWVLDHYKDRHKLITQECSRGRGRQIAFENSTGDYIITNLDMDDYFKDSLKELLKLYHGKAEGNLLVALTYWEQKEPGTLQRARSFCTIVPRNLLAELGGFRDLQYAEDWDLWCRAARAGKYRWLCFPLVMYQRESMSMGRFRSKFEHQRDVIRAGMTVRQAKNKIYPIAYIAALLKGIYADEYARRFDMFGRQYHIPTEFDPYVVFKDGSTIGVKK